MLGRGIGYRNFGIVKARALVSGYHYQFRHLGGFRLFMDLAYLQTKGSYVV